MSRPIAYVPLCTNGFTVVDYSTEEAATYDPLSLQYYLEKVGSNIGGIILSCILGVITIVWFIWLVIPKLRGFHWPKVSRYAMLEPGQEDEAILKGRDPWAAPKSSFPWLKVVIGLMLLSLLGCAIWAMVEGIRTINYLYNGAIVMTKDVAQDGGLLLDKTSSLLNETSSVLNDLNGFVASFKNATGASDDDGKLGIALQNAEESAQDAATTIWNLEQKAKEVYNALVGGWQNFDETMGTKLAVSILIVLFSIIAICVVFIAVGVYMRKTKFLAWFTWFFLLMSTLMMIMGTIVFSTGFKVSKDTCLYIETYALNQVVASVPEAEALLQYLSTAATSADGTVVSEFTSRRNLQATFTPDLSKFGGVSDVFFPSGNASSPFTSNPYNWDEVLEERVDDVIPPHLIDVYYNISGSIASMRENGFPGLGSNVTGKIAAGLLRELAESPVGAAFAKAYASNLTVAGLGFAQVLDSIANSAPVELQPILPDIFSYLASEGIDFEDILEAVAELEFVNASMLINIIIGVVNLPQVSEAILASTDIDVDIAKAVIGCLSQLADIAREVAFELLPMLWDAVKFVTTIAVEHLYGDSKKFICCGLGNSLDMLYVAWTVTGSVASATGLFVMLHVFLKTKPLQAYS